MSTGPLHSVSEITPELLSALGATTTAQDPLWLRDIYEHPQYVQHRPFCRSVRTINRDVTAWCWKTGGTTGVALVNFGSGHDIRKICHWHFL